MSEECVMYKHAVNFFLLKEKPKDFLKPQSQYIKSHPRLIPLKEVNVYIVNSTSNYTTY